MTPKEIREELTLAHEQLGETVKSVTGNAHEFIGKLVAGDLTEQDRDDFADTQSGDQVGRLTNKELHAFGEVFNRLHRVRKALAAQKLESGASRQSGRAAPA
jgi:hypothetical protein